MKCECIEFELGDHVVYPHHGAGKVQSKEEMEVLGETREYLTIKILHNDMTVKVPTENAALAGLRRVIDEETVKKVLDVLHDEVSEMPKNWNRRFKHNRDKIKTGDIYELAEVVRNLALRETEKGLSTGEKQMFTRAKKILASELMYALDKDEDEAEDYLDELLAGGRPAARRPWRSSRRGSHARGSVLDRRLPRARKPLSETTMAVALIVAAGAASVWAPDGPRRSSSSPAGRCLQWSVDALRGVPGGAADRGRAAPGRARARGHGRRARAARCARSRCASRWPPPAPGDPVLVHDAARPLAHGGARRAGARGARRRSDGGWTARSPPRR